MHSRAKSAHVTSSAPQVEAARTLGANDWQPPFILTHTTTHTTTHMHAFACPQEEAARTLGANDWQVFWNVTLPNIRWVLRHSSMYPDLAWQSLLFLYRFGQAISPVPLCTSRWQVLCICIYTYI